VSPTAHEMEQAAKALGWQFSRPVPNGIVMWKGGCMIDVTLTPLGYVARAERYEFARLDDLHFKERVIGKHKKPAILAWLATDW
jgi:hypothetical protein